MVKNLPVNTRDEGSISGSGKSPGGGNDNPLQYSCLGNPMDRRAWWATLHRVAKNQTRLSTHACHPIVGDVDLSMGLSPRLHLG